jgi:hypothetical protein
VKNGPLSLRNVRWVLNVKDKGGDQLMRIILYCFLMLFFLAGCEMHPMKGNSVIDWVDFIKLNGKEYSSIPELVIADPSKVKGLIGTVKFKVSDNVTNPNYRIKEGDAAFLDEGTKIFAIDGYPTHTFVAVKDDNLVHGFRVYFAREDVEQFKWHFKDVSKEKVKKIEIYYNEDYKRNKFIKTLEGSSVDEFFAVLDRGETRPNFSPSITKSDPKRYIMVIYTDDVLAYSYSLFFDGETYYWHPWDTAVLPKDIEMYIK